MANWSGVLVPPEIPSTLAGLGAKLDRMADLLATIAARSRRVQDRATWYALPFVTPTPMSIVSIILSGDTAGLYNLSIGGEVQPGVYVPANSAIQINLDGPAAIAVMTGVWLKATGPAAVSASVFAKPAEVTGREAG